MSFFMLLGLVIIIPVVVYTYIRLKRAAKFYGLDTGNKKVKIVVILLTIIVAILSLNITSAISIVVLHLLVASLVLDIVAFIVGKIRRANKEQSLSIWRKIYESGIIAVLITAVMVSYGVYNVWNVVETKYTFDTQKEVGSSGYRIALLTDTHYGTIQDTDVLKNKIDDINKANADVVVLGGDIVEEGTSKEEMKEVFKLLGGINSKYGVYFVYGNHDRQHYRNNGTYTPEELEQAIKENGIEILADRYVNIGEHLILAGREDAGWGNDSGRLSSEEVLSGADKDKYIVMVDHQPIGADENDGQGVDLQLSGHTHGGQVWPLGPLTELTGGLRYGEYTEGNCTVVVSSGVAGWGYPIKTGERSEYVIIDIK